MRESRSFSAGSLAEHVSYAGWIGTVGAAHEGVPHPTLEDAATRLAAIAGTSTCHIAQSKEGILVPGVVGPIQSR
jgi:ribulose kinase